MINIRNNKLALILFFVIVLILQIFLIFKLEVLNNIIFVTNLVHLHMILPLTLWGYSLYYRITDLKIRRLSMVFVLLLILWMILKFYKGITDNYEHIEILWYLFYLPMLMNLYIYNKMLVYSYNNNPNKIIDKVLLLITCLLILLVLTNRNHNIVFIFSDVTKPSIYTYNFGYNLIVIWMVFLSVLSIINMFKIYKNRKKYSLIYILIFFILIFIHNRYYVLRIPRIFSSDFSLMYTIVFIYLLEASIRLNILPGNYYYNEVFNIPNLNLFIVDNNFNIKYQPTGNNTIPHDVFKNIKKDIISQEIYSKNNKDIMYKVDKIDGGFSIKIIDVFVINKLMKEVNTKSIVINRQNKILTIEQDLKRKITKQKISSNIKNKVDEVLIKKIDLINEYTDLIYGEDLSLQQDYLLLAYIKIFVGYCKNKASLILKGMKNKYISSDDFSIIMHNIIQDSYTAKIEGQVFVTINNDIDINNVHSIFDITNNILEKCTRFSKSNLFLKISENKQYYTYDVIIDVYDINGIFIFKLANIIQNIKVSTKKISYDDSSILINLSFKKEGDVNA
ncbi:MAG: hypothetical protein GX675_00565 [Erysipelotrichaceae bacterium]|nr:hypothetical protein [Erysipelotrichaceae bacterium]